MGLSEDDYEAKVMEKFDISDDSHISETEFVQGVSNWLDQAQLSANDQGHDRSKVSDNNSKVKIDK